jgi:hypothetical protein
MSFRNLVIAAALSSTVSVPALAQKFPLQTGREHGSASLVLATRGARIHPWCLLDYSAGVRDCSYHNRRQCAATAAGGLGECVLDSPER